MSSALVALLLALAAVLAFGPAQGAAARLRRAGFRGAGAAGGRGREGLLARQLRRREGTAGRLGRYGWGPYRWGRNRRGTGAAPGLSLTVVVQQLAALLKGGRSPGRLWEELWVLYGQPQGTREGVPAPGSLTPASLAVIAAARAAAANGTPVSAAIRRSLAAGGADQRGISRHHRDARIWSELAACFDIAEASGCPLADVLTRFAAQLEVEDDAHAARQTALAGPKATVALLTWLPVLGLGLGAALGVDPLSVLFGTPLGLAALAAGAGLTVAGRIWSAKLVATAAAAGLP